MKRRELLSLAAATTLLGACDAARPELQGGWVGASDERGHRLRQPLPLPQGLAGGTPKRCHTLIIGAGVSGLACARTLKRSGLDDFALLELEDQAGGNSRGHQMAGMACPLGAHYLPLPGKDSPEVYRLLEDLGLVRQELGRAVFDERHLCHSPQERLFFEGQWHEGLLPPALKPETRKQYLGFAAAVRRAQKELGFAMPTHRAPWTAGHQALDAQTFANWLEHQGLNDSQLRWYLDYCCRDDFGAPAGEVSAWAGLHYFASRHGFHPPGDETQEREAVLTWPQGNAFLTQQMAAELGPHLHCGRSVLKIEGGSGKQGFEVWAWNEAQQEAERWQARQLVLATPLFIAQKLLGRGVSAALDDAAKLMSYAPWLVANLQTRGPLMQRVGAAPSWDNVVYGSAALGYVDATHQSLRPDQGATVLTAYWALPASQRASLLKDSWQQWSTRVLQELATVHPDLGEQLQAVALMRWGHAMSIPRPGVRGAPALRALANSQTGRPDLHFAHADLSAYSVFEEAYTHGAKLAGRLRRG
ncbi:monoamine oxidase [Paucibacter oligotrophus]|uniref:Monoamine oxidase n=1 Tax=Roseateles oligotrophus TaxID=1769250 RepID=A0A840L249_9BURK|nr:FAD-dependent oxidoreductase [Roseateles oligotrophus]MBB4841976.1 monoamine oxidase [Roseateles oligotrophus]